MELNDELVINLFKKYKGNIDIDAYVSKLMLLNSPINSNDVFIFPKTYMFYSKGRFHHIAFATSKGLGRIKDIYPFSGFTVLGRNEHNFSKFNLVTNFNFQNTLLDKISIYLLMYCEGFVDFIFKNLISLEFYYLCTFNILSEQEYIPNKYINDFYINDTLFKLETTSNMMVKISKECKYGTVIKEVSINSEYLIRNWWISELIRGRDFQVHDESLFDNLLQG